MNPKDIIQAIKEGRGSARVLWFLQSLILEGGDQLNLCSELKRVLPEEVESLRAKGLLGSSVTVGEAITLIGRGYNTRALGGCNRRVIELLGSYVQRVEEAATRSFYQTNIGREVWSALDWCLEERRPCFLQGREGRGKSASARAWFEAHRSQARYFSCSGLGAQRDHLYGLAHAYGVRHSGTKVPDAIVRSKIVEAIVHSGLVLIIDEAHALLPDQNSKASPRLIDFIDRDLCNAGVAVALISTPQFGRRLADFEDRTGWNAGQFRRRFAGKWCALSAKTDDADLRALAEQFLPNVGAKGMKLAVGYAGAFDRDVSGMFDLIRDAQRRARKAGREAISYQDLRDAYELDRVPSENAMAESFNRQNRPGPSPADTFPSDSGDSAALLPPSRSSEIVDPNPRHLALSPAGLVQPVI